MRISFLVFLLLASLLAPTGARAGEASEPFNELTAPVALQDVSGVDFALRWAKVQLRWRSQRAEVTVCTNAPEICTPEAMRFLKIVAALKSLRKFDRLTFLLHFLHTAITYATDLEQWGVEEKWSPPLETLATAKGDCEDFAILTYDLLQEVGFSPENLRMVVLHWRPSDPELHAVAAVRYLGEWYIVDNNAHAILPDKKEFYDKIRYVFDKKGAQRYLTTQTTAAR